MRKYYSDRVRNWLRICILGLAAVVLMHPASGLAADSDDHWEGLADGYWGTDANWTNCCAVFPSGANSHVLDFSPLGFLRLTCTNNMSGKTFSGINLTCSGYDLRGNAFFCYFSLLAQYAGGSTIENAITLEPTLTVFPNVNYNIDVNTSVTTLFLTGPVTFADSTYDFFNVRANGYLYASGSWASAVDSIVNFSGTGTTELAAGGNSMSGTNTLAAGSTLLVDGILGSALVNVSGTLRGAGTIGRVALASGHLQPGTSASTGIMTVLSNFTADASSTMTFRLNNTNAGTGYDQLRSLTVNGTISLGNCQLALLPSGPPIAGATYTIIDRAGTNKVTGTFAGWAEGTSNFVGNAFYQITYKGGTNGNDVILTAGTPSAVWHGTTGPNTGWNISTNWVNNISAQNNYDLIFPASPLGFTSSNNIIFQTYNRIIFQVAGYNLIGFPIPLRGGIIDNNVTGGENSIGPVLLTADQTWTEHLGVLAATGTSVDTFNLTLDGGTNGADFFLTSLGAGSGTIWITSAFVPLFGTSTFSGSMQLLSGEVEFESGSDYTSMANIVDTGGRLEIDANTPSITTLGASAIVQVGAPGIFDTVGNFDMEFGTLQPILTNPSLARRLRVRGSVTLTGNVILQILGGYAPNVGDSTMLLENAGDAPIAGELAFLPEGALFKPAASPAALHPYRITYHGGDGNDLVITAVPTPHIWNGVGVSGTWSTSGNWQSNSPPAAGDGMIFPQGVTALMVTNDLPAFTAFESIEISSNYTFFGNAIALTGGFIGDDSAVFNPAVRVAAGQVWNVQSNFVVNGAVDINTNQLNFAGGGSVIFSNNVTGTSGAVSSVGGLSALTFNGSNNYSGLTHMWGGVLTFNGTNMNGPVLVEQADWNVATSALVGNSLVTFNGGASNVAAFGGRLLNGLLIMSNGNFNVLATGVVSNSPVGITGGTLSVLGQLLASPITLFGGTLAGSGTVTNVMGANGMIAPGGATNAGRLHTGNLSLGAGVTVRFKIAGTVPGVSHDQLQVTGSVNLSNATLHLTLVDQTLNLGDTIVLIDNDGADPIVSAFVGLPEGSTFPLGLLDVKLSYVGGTGNDVTLTVVGKIPRATWTGLGSTNDWSTATNWVRNTPPLDGDSLYFPAVPANLVNFNSLGSTSYTTMFIGGSNYNIQAGNVALTGGIIATNPVGTNLVDSVLPTFSSIISNTAGNTLILTGVYQDAPLNFQLGGSLEFRGDLAGGSNLVMAGNGTLHIYNTNPAFHGNFTLQGGLTEANTTNSFGNQGANSISISNGATLLMKAAGEYGSSFFIGGTQHIATAGAIIVDGGNVLTSSNLSYVVDAGASLTLNGIVSGAYGLRKDGPGEMFLTVTNFYTGGTLVNGGVLYVSGVPTNAPAGALNVNNGATLRGRGPCGPIFVNNGVLAPGYNDLHASLSSHDGISMNSQSTYRVRISNVPATTYDNIAVNGPVVLVSPQLQLVMDFRPPVGSSFTLIDNDGADPIIGTFASLPQNSFYTNGPTVFRILYNGGTGNDIVAVADHYLSTGITRAWTGAGTNALWSNAQNWATNIAPHSGDALYFPPGALQLTNLNDFPSNTFFQAVTIGGANYRLAGNLVAVIGGCTATNTSGLNTIALPIAILTNMTFRCEAPGATLAFEGAVDNNSRRLLLGGNGMVLGIGPVIGLGDLEQSGPGVTELRGTNTYVGETKVSGGRLRFQNSPLGLAGGGVVITNNAILELSAVTNVVEDFTISGTMLVTNVSYSSIQGNFDFPTNKTATFNVAPGTLAGLFPSFTHDGGGPIKEGLGDLYVAAGDLKKDVYTGPAVINNGRVIFDSQTKGVASDFGTFIVNSGATLAATGQVNHVVVNAGGLLAPGLFSGVGPLVVEGNLTFSPGANLSIDLQGVTPDLDFDTILVQGAVNLGNANLKVVLGYPAVLDSEYQIITSTGGNPIIGTFAGLSQGTTFFTAGASYQISYVGGDGNDVLLTLVASPPSITSFGSLPNGSKKIVGTAQPGWFALIEAATNMAPPVNWQLLDVQIPDGTGIISYTDTDATNHPVRFYRISAP